MMSGDVFALLAIMYGDASKKQFVSAQCFLSGIKLVALEVKAGGPRNSLHVTDLTYT